METRDLSVPLPATQATYLVVPAAEADAKVASSPSFAGAMSTFEAALAAGVPIADLLKAQASR